MVTLKVDQLQVMQATQLTESQRQAAQSAIQVTYLDFHGLKRVMFDRISNDFDLHQFDDNACQHLNTFVD